MNTVYNRSTRFRLWLWTVVRSLGARLETHLRTKAFDLVLQDLQAMGYRSGTRLFVQGSSTDEPRLPVRIDHVTVSEDQGKLKALIWIGATPGRIPLGLSPQELSKVFLGFMTDEQSNYFDTVDEMNQAMGVAEYLGKKEENIKTYDWAKEQADRYGLWAEVCWSANLNHEMTAEQFSTALGHGLSEWDV